MQDSLTKLLNTLIEREKFVLIHYYGLQGESAKTLSEIGILIQRTATRVGQIKSKALRKCRHFSRIDFHHDIPDSKFKQEISKRYDNI